MNEIEQFLKQRAYTATQLAEIIEKYQYDQACTGPSTSRKRSRWDMSSPPLETGPTPSRRSAPYSSSYGSYHYETAGPSRNSAETSQSCSRYLSSSAEYPAETQTKPVTSRERMGFAPPSQETGLSFLQQRAYPATQLAYPATQFAYPATQLAHPATQFAYPATQLAEMTERIHYNEALDSVPHTSRNTSGQRMSPSLLAAEPIPRYSGGFSSRHSEPSSPPRNSESKSRFASISKTKPALIHPPLGEPGGRDDERRRGLSGAGVKWYLRFLAQGMDPDEARNETLKRKTSATAPKPEDTCAPRPVEPKRLGEPGTQNEALKRKSSATAPKPENTRAPRPEEPKRLGEPGARDDPHKKGLSDALYLHFLAQGMDPNEARNEALKMKSSDTAPEPDDTRAPRPGERGDRRKFGLSGAGCKWYRRFLADGMEPDQAREEALKMKTTRALSPAPSRSRESERYASKRRSPPRRSDHYEHKRSSTSVKAPHRTEVTHSTRSHAGPSTAPPQRNNLTSHTIVVCPKKYPACCLSQEQLSKLEEAILDEVDCGWEHPLNFCGIHFRAGYLTVNCSNAETADWLLAVAPKLKQWKGAELIACKPSSMPCSFTVTIYLPRSAEQDEEKLLTRLAAQNKGINTSSWNILKKRDEGNGQVWQVGIDKESWRSIEANGNVLFYRFGQIPVHRRKQASMATVEEAKGDEVPT